MLPSCYRHVGFLIAISALSIGFRVSCGPDFGPNPLPLPSASESCDGPVLAFVHAISSTLDSTPTYGSHGVNLSHDIPDKKTKGAQGFLTFPWHLCFGRKTRKKMAVSTRDRTGDLSRVRRT